MQESNFYAICFYFNTLSQPLNVKLEMVEKLKNYLESHEDILLEDDIPVSAAEILDPILNGQRGLHEVYSDTLLFAHMSSSEREEIGLLGFDVSLLSKSETSYYRSLFLN